MQINPETLEYTFVSDTALTGSTYSHGLTFSETSMWIGTWQDTPCYIYRVPKSMELKYPEAFPIFFDGAQTNYTFATGQIYPDTNSITTTESLTQRPVGVSAKLQRFTINILANDFGAPVYARVRKNGADASASITIPLGTTGVFTKNLIGEGISYDADDLISIRFFVGDTAGGIDIGKITVTMIR